MTVRVYTGGGVVEAIDTAPVPIVTGLPDPSITDAPGGLTAEAVYGRAAANAPPIEPFLPWYGQNNAAVASVQFAAGVLGAVTFLGMPALKGSPVQIGLVAWGTATIEISGRSSATPPALTVTYTDGTSEALALVAAPQANSSTVYLLPNQSTLLISGGSTPWLRFAAPSKDVKMAALTIYATKVWVAGKVNVVRFTAGYLQQPTVLPAWGGTEILTTECFEDGPKYITDRMIGAAADPLNQRRFVNDPAGRALELWLDPATSGVLDLKVGIFPEATEAWCGFDIMFMPGSMAAVVENGKLPGFGSATRPDDAAVVAQYGLPFPAGTIGSLLAGNGGAKVNGKNGWSDRGDWLAPLKAPHPLAGKWPLSSYVYTPDFNDYNGLQMPWSAYGTGAVAEGVWHRVEHRLKVNTVPAAGRGNQNGEIETRINGKLALLRKGLRLRDASPYDLAIYGVTTDLLIRFFWLCCYHGGHALPLFRTAFLRMRNFTIWRMA